MRPMACLGRDYATRYGSFDMEAEPERVFAPGGDSWRTFHERVRGMCEQIATDFADQTVVAVCHAGVIMASIHVLFGIPHPGTGHATSTCEYRTDRMGVRPQPGTLDAPQLQ